MSSSQKPRKGGFKLKNLPEDAYKGQQQRLKQNLIQKAKLKKNYAKILKQEASTADQNLVQTSEATKSAAETDVIKNSFTDFGNEDTPITHEDHDSGEEALPNLTQPEPDLQHKSYRQRARERKKDPTAAKAYEIRMERDRDRQIVAAKRSQIEKKRADRVHIKKREMSRTKKGQPLMKDRMQNILDKLQSDS